MSKLRLSVALLALGLCCAAVAPARAQQLPPAALAAADGQVIQVLNVAAAAYDNFDFNASIGLLQQGVAIIRQTGLRSRAAADLYLLDGVVRYAASGAEGDAVNAFVQAMLVDPNARLHPNYATPALEILLQRARGLANPAASRPAPSAPPPAPVAPPAARPTPTLVPKPPPAPAGQLPSLGAMGVGGYTPPPAAPPAPVAAPAPVARASRPPQTAAPSKSRGSDWGALEDDDRASGSAKNFSFAVGGGFGAGLATGEPDVVTDVKLGSGVALTPGHASVEFGYRISERAEIMPFARLQVVTLESGTEVEPIFGAKVRNYLTNTGMLDFYVEGGLGYGYVRHFVYVADKKDYVTTSEGPFHAGGGGGLRYAFNASGGLTAGGYLMGLGGDATSVQFDLQGLLYFRF